MIHPEESQNPWRDDQAPDPPRVAQAARALAGVKGWEARAKGRARIHEHWEEIAGGNLARHVTPVRLLRGVLVLQADSPSWAAQVPFLQTQFIQRGNEVLGADEITQVKVIGATRRR